MLGTPPSGHVLTCLRLILDLSETCLDFGLRTPDSRLLFGLLLFRKRCAALVAKLIRWRIARTTAWATMFELCSALTTELRAFGVVVATFRTPHNASSRLSPFSDPLSMAGTARPTFLMKSSFLHPSTSPHYAQGERNLLIFPSLRLPCFGSSEIRQELQHILIDQLRLLLLYPVTALGDVFDLETIGEILIHVVSEFLAKGDVFFTPNE